MTAVTERPCERCGSVPTSLDEIENMLAELHAMKGWDYAIEVKVSAHTAWQAEVRITPAPFRDHEADRSYVSFRCHADLGCAVAAAAADVLGWIASVAPPICPDCAFCEQPARSDAAAEPLTAP
jgi:hypothetical protein